MAITSYSVSPVDLTTIKMGFVSSLTPPIPFRVYSGGALIASWSAPTTAGEILLTIPPGDAPFVEVLDVACANPKVAYPGRITLQWTAVSGAARYRIDEYVASVWTERSTLADNGEGSFSWVSRWLEDVTTHQFRIVPISSAANEGTPITQTVLMVRHPNPPDVEYTYDGAVDQTVTISAA